MGETPGYNARQQLRPTTDLQSPPTSTARPRAASASARSFSFTVTLAGFMLGSNAINVPMITIITPDQIHITSGFTCALMIGLPVSWLRPVYTRYKSPLGRERLATMVEVCSLAL